MKNAQAALHGLKSVPSFQGSYTITFLTLVIMATNRSAEIDGEQHEFLSALIQDLVDQGRTTAVEAMGVAVWLNTFR